MAMRQKALIFSLAALLALGFSADGFAKPGFGGSFGSRGARTFSAPPSTTTAPRAAAPIERSMSSPSAGLSQGFARSPAATTGGFLSGGFGRGLLGGLVGAGLVGMLFGNGFGGGLGGLTSILGLVLQIGLLFLLFKFVMGFLRGRQPAYQGAGFDRGVAPGPGPAAGFSGLRGFGGGAAASAKLEVGPADFNVFEQRLSLVQKAYGAEDIAALRSLATPEMVSYFSEEIEATAKKGLVNKISDVTFLQGDLAEAWREPGSDYASVAVRFSLIDTMVDRATGKVVSGDPTTPEISTEIWTFARRPGGAPADWTLSAIQQA
ncbi:Tim44 domain-containing protein [Methylocapsa palsarum]|uniref:Predicted lipid-binding transport protein, Tim44 family n=1 Tax=Methylocapsa palsarum TaxID=1612308 RepID=A0A1I4A454_9HYPH|nr:TIM44-like domain-containing protein [Methylocapsa palsarum]SFK51108.1 Predicted lipid-binding transport protein, Tim44 family [Methylocapsa palsarum]